jgi:hypothetical protein
LVKMTKRNIKVKSLLAKWLLISTLFVGIFGFSGSAGQSSFQQQKTQTEFLFSNNVRSGGRFANYKLSAVYSRSALATVGVVHRNAILTYGRLLKVRFDLLSRQPVFVSTCCLFRHVKTIPQSSGEDISAFLIG